jgi:hypothetical protein
LVLTAGATTVSDDNTLERFEDADESALVLPESTNCLFMKDGFGLTL